jgi:protein required for attachment to host cells
MAKPNEFLLPNAPTCIVACAADGARLWRSTSRFGDWSTLAEISDGDPARPEKSFASDRPGRAFDSFGSGRHAMATSESGRRHEVRKFARQVADYLNSEIAANSFDNIVLIASPAFLGHVRAELSETARRAVVHESAKDLTDLDADAIKQYFT